MLAVEAAVILLAGCVILIVMWARTLSESTRAQAFLTDITRLEVGRSTLEDAEAVAQKHGGRIASGTGPCTYEACKFQFLFENKPFTSTHLVPYTGLIGTLFVKNGVVTERQIGYFRYARRPFVYNVRETMFPAGDTPEAEAMKRLIGLRRMKVDKEGIPSAVSIDLEPSTSIDERNRAYALNVSCLSKVFGCNRPSAIFPSAIRYQGPPLQTHTPTW